MITFKGGTNDPLLELLFSECDTDLEALDDRLKAARRFCVAAVGGSGGTAARVVANEPDGTTHLVSMAQQGVELSVERLRSQGTVAACCTFGLRSPLLPAAKMHTAFVHRLEAYVVVSWPSNTCQMLKLSLQRASSGSQPRERVKLVQCAALPPLSPMLSAVDGGAGAAYLLACGDHRLFRFLCADQSLEELSKRGWPCDRQAVALWVHASKLLALTRKHSSSRSSAESEQLELWELPAAEAVLAGGGKWEAVHGSGIKLPACRRGCDILAAPYQGDQWLVVQQPHEQASAPGASASSPEAAAVVVLYCMSSNRWSAPSPLQPASTCGATAPHTVEPSLQLGGISEEVGGPAYFKEHMGNTDSLSVSQAALAGSAAMLRHMPVAHSDCTGGMQRQQQHQQVAMVADTQGCVWAVWWEWTLLPPIRLGEIPAPQMLPYSLRQAQALRAALASHGTTDSHTGTDLAADVCCGDAHSNVLLQIASHPPLPAIVCPPTAALQCGELKRQLEVLEEAGTAAGGADGGQVVQPRQLLVLAGVSFEEHAALQQLVNCLAGRTHAGLLEATQLLDVIRLADLLDAPALLEECIAVVACIVPGLDMVAPMLALAEARQYHTALQRLALFYRHALVLLMLRGQRSLLQWALHGLAAGVDTILEVCTEVAHTWLPLEPEGYLGSPSSDLAALDSLKCQQQPPETLRLLLAAMVVLLERRPLGGQCLQAGVQQRSSALAKKARLLGPFQSAASKPLLDPASVQGRPYHSLVPWLQRLLLQVQRTLPQQAARRRSELTTAAFQAAEVRARRHEQVKVL